MYAMANTHNCTALLQKLKYLYGIILKRSLARYLNKITLNFVQIVYIGQIQNILMEIFHACIQTLPHIQNKKKPVHLSKCVR